MNLALFAKAFDMIKDVMKLSETVVKSADSDKYVESVEKLHRGVSDSYEQMRQVIVDSDEFSDAEKIERLQKLAQQEAEAKENCGKVIEGDREHVAKIVKDVVAGLLTCGLSFVPEIAKKLRESLTENMAEIEDKESKELVGQVVSETPDESSDTE